MTTLLFSGWKMTGSSALPVRVKLEMVTCSSYVPGRMLKVTRSRGSLRIQGIDGRREGGIIGTESADGINSAKLGLGLPYEQ